MYTDRRMNMMVRVKSAKISIHLEKSALNLYFFRSGDPVICRLMLRFVQKPFVFLPRMFINNKVPRDGVLSCRFYYVICIAKGKTIVQNNVIK